MKRNFGTRWVGKTNLINRNKKYSKTVNDISKYKAIIIQLKYHYIILNILFCGEIVINLELQKPRDNFNLIIIVLGYHYCLVF